MLIILCASCLEYYTGCIASCQKCGVMKVRGNSGPKILFQNQLNVYILTVRQYWLGKVKPKNIFRSILNPSIKWFLHLTDFSIDLITNAFRHQERLGLYRLDFFTNQCPWCAFSPTAAATMLASCCYLWTPLCPPSFFTAMYFLKFLSWTTIHNRDGHDFFLPKL